MTTSAMQRPDAVFIWGAPGGDPDAAFRDAEGVWSTRIADVTLTESTEGLTVTLLAHNSGVSRIGLRWREGVHEDALVLGDAWERSYGNLRWEHLQPERVLPWYWIATSPGRATRGGGVRVRPGAWCSWTVDVDGITLWLDVTSGSGPVHLGDRMLDVATLVSLTAPAETTAYDAHRELCAALCSDPLPTAGPLVGCNNWYYAYGVNFDADAVVRDAAVIALLSGDHPVRPYCVIDAGWSEGGVAPGGPWHTGMESFRKMDSVATRIREEGARPGLWFRPLLSRVPGALTQDALFDGGWPLDPSREETLQLVREDIGRFREWGYDLIKHDFSTHDVLGRFLPGAESTMTSRWSFADNSRTTAEILVGFYRAVHESAGESVIIGCNTVGHLAAGLIQVQRTGDDTSGRQWERTRRMGVNTLAFRLAQHGTFFTMDADCVPSTLATPWELNSQFLDLVARSGSALFISVDPKTHDSRVDADLRRAVRVALDGGVAGGVEPHDWQQTTAPRRWRVGNADTEYAWGRPWGVDAHLASI